MVKRAETIQQEQRAEYERGRQDALFRRFPSHPGWCVFLEGLPSPTATDDPYVLSARLQAQSSPGAFSVLPDGYMFVPLSGDEER